MGVAENEIRQSVVQSTFKVLFLAHSLASSKPIYIVLLSSHSELHSDSGLILVATVKFKIRSKGVSQRWIWGVEWRWGEKLSGN